jgi:hypothetical protein
VYLSKRLREFMNERLRWRVAAEPQNALPAWKIVANCGLARMKASKKDDANASCDDVRKYATNVHTTRCAAPPRSIAWVGVIGDAASARLSP